jgi:glycosyltransferase involved in cell wall biosynthesis
VVLHVRVLSGSGGGPERTILQSAAHFDTSDYWLGAAYLHPPGDVGVESLQRRAAAQRCPFISIADRGPLDLRPVRELFALCRHLDVRIWHGHDYKSDLLGLLLRRLHRMALVATVHGWVTLTPRTRLYYALDRRCLRHFDHVAAVSRALCDEVGALGVDAERRSLLLNGVDGDVFRRQVEAAAAPLRVRRRVPVERFVIGTAGRLTEEKRHADLIRATHALLQEGRDVALWIAGEGAEHPRLEALIGRLALADRVVLLGFLEDAREFYAASDLFVLSSVREGLPNALLEAMAMGLPVVAANVDGVPEVVCDGENGLLYEAEDVGALTAQLRRLLDDPALRSRLAQAARRKVEERFRFAARVDAERAIYDRVIGRR